MRKGLKVLTISLVAAILIIVATTGVVLAAGPDSEDCTHPNCPNIDCPNCDGTCDGTGLMFQKGHGPQYQYRSGE